MPPKGARVTARYRAAHVAVWIERPGKGFILSRPVLVTQPVTTDAWKPYESTVDVPADATTIAYGIVLAGDGMVSAPREVTGSRRMRSGAVGSRP